MKMRKVIFLTFIILATGCYKNQDSSTNDAGGLTVNPGDSVEFIAAKTLFVGSCGGGGCHGDFASKTEAQFKSEGLIIAGDPDNSSVYCRLAGSTGSCGSKNMPKNQPALDSTELQTISDWITAVAP